MIFGILCAMDEEIKSLKESLNDSKVVDIKGIYFYKGVINHQSVVLVRSGIGKVEAGLTTALLIAHFNVDFVINSGSAGGIGKDLSVGDVVVSTETVYHDVDATPAGYAYGQLPNQPQKFKSSEKLGNDIVKASKNTGLNPKKGLIVSGDQFVGNQKDVNKVLTHFPNALACEMEGAAVGQVAHQFEVPYVVIRSISDTGNEEANESFEKFIVQAGKDSAQMLLNLFKNQEY